MATVAVVALAEMEATGATVPGLSHSTVPVYTRLPTAAMAVPQVTAVAAAAVVVVREGLV
jgi:hypothetical protein